jgi:hypothetical protein
MECVKVQHVANNQFKSYLSLEYMLVMFVIFGPY